MEGGGAGVAADECPALVARVTGVVVVTPARSLEVGMTLTLLTKKAHTYVISDQV